MKRFIKRTVLSLVLVNLFSAYAQIKDYVGVVS